MGKKRGKTREEAAKAQLEKVIQEYGLQELEDGCYYVERVLDKRIATSKVKGKKVKVTEYKVKWLGFPMSDATWEPVNSVPEEFVQQWEEDNKAKMAAEKALNNGSAAKKVKTEPSVNTDNSTPIIPDPKPEGAAKRKVPTEDVSVAAKINQAELFTCNACNALETREQEFQLCKPCLDEGIQTRYCSVDCQRKDWNTHKLVCPFARKAVTIIKQEVQEPSPEACVGMF
eukprot:TRINITY_DN5913_c0_g2_i1.p1 TRINITY_DN5913_c0_g2~~TRINITY_DN5913_c0_g2_i1.p1  ORF type:complete len:229 (+),score=64.92 TRINITY_DN5913_c0_g2_i1:96-782(+)